MMSIVLIVAAVVAGVVLVMVGLFSLAAILWGDLLEPDTAPPSRRMSKAA